MLGRLALTLLSGVTFTMCKGGPVPEGCCTPPDRLDVVYHPGVPNTEDIVECDQSGGELIYDPAKNTSTCEGVDY